MKDKFIEHFTGKKNPFQYLSSFLVQNISCSPVDEVEMCDPALFRIAYLHNTLNVSAVYIVYGDFPCHMTCYLCHMFTL